MDSQTIFERFTLMNNAYCRYSFSYFLDSMEQLGLHNIDLWGGYPHFYFPYMQWSEISAFAHAIDQRNMRIICFTPETLAYPLNIASDDDMVLSRSIDYYKRSIRIAADLGVSKVLVNAGWGLYDGNREHAFNRSAESLRELAETAGELNVMLLLEHLTPQSSNLINRSGDVRDMLKKVQSPYLKCALDLGQMSVFGEMPSDYFDLLPGDVQQIHIMDGAPAGHLAFGDGILPLEAYYREIGTYGYQSLFTLEINDRRYVLDPHSAIKKCITALQQWA